MDRWITVKTFTLSSQVAVPRSILESEGITCFVKNELTIQINPFYSNAMGGVELQVQNKDLDRAISVLKEAGFETDLPGSRILSFPKFDKKTRNIPLLKHIHPAFRLITIILILLGTVIGVGIYISLPTLSEELSDTPWCVDQVIYQRKEFIPQTIGPAKIYLSETCLEYIQINYNGDIIFPGFQSPYIHGIWKLTNNQLIVSKCDTFGFVYDATYHISLKDNTLILESKNSKIICHKQPEIDVPLFF
ncbi:MAG: hypothetical protein GC181_12645 [Bacteroidetes bacterium]|nr:hypothetical protein [Bacteroidota bacterium]